MGAGATGVEIPASNYMACAGTKTTKAIRATPLAGPSVAASDDGAIYDFRAVRMSEVLDGTSNTLLLGEVGRGPDGIAQGVWFVSGDIFAQRVASAGINRAYAPPMPFAENMTDTGNVPRNGPGNMLGFGSWHPGGANFAFCDGSVKFLKATTDLAEVLSALGTRRRRRGDFGV